MHQSSLFIIEPGIVSRQAMEEERLSHHDDAKNNSRRSRKDDEGRDFICGCGKKYLSYPALYTHIKKKHQGQQPEGTQKIGVRRPKFRINERLLKEIEGLVTIENLKILTELDDSASGHSNSSLRVRRELVGNTISEAYNNLYRLNSLTLTQSSTLETVLCVYLIAVGQYVSESMMSYYNMFAKNFRNCFIEHGVEIFELCFEKKLGGKICSISTQECKMVPIVCDFFLRFFLPASEKNEDILSVMELICCDFCQWLYLKQLTIVEATLLKEYKVKKSDIIAATKNQKLETRISESSNNKVVEPALKPDDQHSNIMENQSCHAGQELPKQPTQQQQSEDQASQGNRNPQADQQMGQQGQQQNKVNESEVQNPEKSEKQRLPSIQKQQAQNSHSQ